MSMATLCPLTATLVFLGAYCGVIYCRFSTMHYEFSDLHRRNNLRDLLHCVLHTKLVFNNKISRKKLSFSFRSKSSEKLSVGWTLSEKFSGDAASGASSLMYDGGLIVVNARDLYVAVVKRRPCNFLTKSRKRLLNA